jgi:hypothetical protein
MFNLKICFRWLMHYSCGMVDHNRFSSACSGGLSNDLCSKWISLSHKLELWLFVLNGSSNWSNITSADSSSSIGCMVMMMNS